MEGGTRKISPNPPVSQNLLAFRSLKILQYRIYPEELLVANQIFRSLSVTYSEGGAYFVKFAYYDVFFHFFSLFTLKATSIAQKECITWRSLCPLA